MKIFFSFIVCLIVSTAMIAAEPTGHGISPIITLDGKPLDHFDPAKTEYKFYLPHGVHRTPEVKAANATISDLDAERRITVTFNGDESKKYRIIFENLPELELFLCIGQSNMAGRGPMDKNMGDQEPIQNVYLLTPSGNWEPASNPLNRYSTVRKDLSIQQISPAYGFAKKVSATINKPIGLIVNPRGGTSIQEWMKGNKGGFHLYEEAMKRALDAKKWGTYRAILWHQGEANSGQPDAYPEILKRLVADLRNDLDDDQLFFVAGELGYWAKKADGSNANESFNKMLRGIKTFLNHSACVSAEGLTPLNSNIKDPHFDRKSQLLLGERYADAVLKSIYTHIGK